MKVLGAIALFAMLTGVAHAGGNTMDGDIVGRVIRSARAQPAPRIAPSGVDDLPLSEVPVTGQGETMALLITGDGGWASLDQQLSAKLANRGVPVVALSSLSYFWHEQSPEQTAHDVARVLHHYLRKWGRSQVLLIGYSFGADVLPFVVNRLPEDLRSHVESVNLLGLSPHATFEVHVPGWLGGGVEVAPELQRLSQVRVLCVYGEGEKHTLCPGLSVDGVTSTKIGSGHHFSGDAEGLAERILAFAGKQAFQPAPPRVRPLRSRAQAPVTSA